MPQRRRLLFLLVLPVALAALLAVSAGANPSPILAGVNLLDNPGFESGLSSWSVSGQATITSAHKYTGSSALALTKPAPGPASIYQAVMPVMPGATYSASGFFYLMSGGVQNPAMSIEWLSPGGPILAEATVSDDAPTAGWTQIATSGVAPAGATAARVTARVYVMSTGALSYLDDMSFAMTAPPPSATVTASATPSAASTPTPTRTRTRTPTLQNSATRTATQPVPPAHTATRTPAASTATASATLAAGASASTTATPTSTAAETPVPGETPDASATATPTATATATVESAAWRAFLPLVLLQPTPTVTPTPTPDPHWVTLNEFLPNPYVIDWNGDGELGSDDEWVELHNCADIAVDVSGWVLDDEADDGSRIYFLPAGTVIPPHGYLLLFGSQTGLNLANTKEVVRLLYRDGSLLEEYRYYATWHDRSFSRTVDGGGDWTIWYPPTPGEANHP